MGNAVFIIQFAPTPDADKSILRYGLTASARVGNAVVRNRARRRLRALVRDVLLPNAKPAHDYVLIARVETAKRDYADLKKDLLWALGKVGLRNT